MAKAIIERADGSDGVGRFLITVEDDGGAILSRRVILPEGEVKRDWLVSQARRIYKIMQSRKQSAIKANIESARYDNLIQDLTINDSILKNKTRGVK